MAPNAAPKLQANMIVLTIDVLRRSGRKISKNDGRRRVPLARFACQAGDSGRKGRIKISGMAGIKPESNVYRQATCGSLIAPKTDLNADGTSRPGSPAA